LPRNDRACGAPASGAAGSRAGASSAGANSAGATACRGSWNGGSLRNGRGRASCLGGSGDRPFLGGNIDGKWDDGQQEFGLDMLDQKRTHQTHVKTKHM